MLLLHSGLQSEVRGHSSLTKTEHTEHVGWRPDYVSLIINEDELLKICLIYIIKYIISDLKLQSTGLISINEMLDICNLNWECLYVYIYTSI